MRVLVLRNDKLGDFMLAWPALALLKLQYPDIDVTVLVPRYTREMAELCPWIDHIVIEERGRGGPVSCLQLTRRLRRERFDASISLFSEMHTSLALWLSRVPARHGPATKLAQIFLNRRLRQRRSTSSKPEYEYNADLVRDFIARRGDTPLPLPQPPYLVFDETEVKRTRQAYYRDHGIKPECRLVILHPGCGGSAINLSLQQYARLVHLLALGQPLHFVITTGPGEERHALKLGELLSNQSFSIYHSTHGLKAFSRFIACCDLFISGSTGPLHIAGALNVKTAAFYPARRSATALRWQTMNAPPRRVSFAPEHHLGRNEMNTIDITTSAEDILKIITTEK